MKRLLKRESDYQKRLINTLIIENLNTFCTSLVQLLLRSVGGRLLLVVLGLFLSARLSNFLQGALLTFVRDFLLTLHVHLADPCLDLASLRDVRVMFKMHVGGLLKLYLGQRHLVNNCLHKRLLRLLYCGSHWLIPDDFSTRLTFTLLLSNWQGQVEVEDGNIVAVSISRCEHNDVVVAAADVSDLGIVVHLRVYLVRQELVVVITRAEHVIFAHAPRVDVIGLFVECVTVLRFSKDLRDLGFSRQSVHKFRSLEKADVVKVDLLLLLGLGALFSFFDFFCLGSLSCLGHF